MEYGRPVSVKVSRKRTFEELQVSALGQQHEGDLTRLNSSRSTDSKVTPTQENKSIPQPGDKHNQAQRMLAKAAEWVHPEPGSCVGSFSLKVDVEALLGQVLGARGRASRNDVAEVSKSDRL